MNRRSTAVIVALAAVLAGCLEVEQYPVWRDGHYDNKPDNLHPDTLFHRDRLAWNAAVLNRNQLQDEYGRTLPPGGSDHAR